MRLARPPWLGRRGSVPARRNDHPPPALIPLGSPAVVVGQLADRLDNGAPLRAELQHQIASVDRGFSRQLQISIDEAGTGAGHQNPHGKHHRVQVSLQERGGTARARGSRDEEGICPTYHCVNAIIAVTDQGPVVHGRPRQDLGVHPDRGLLGTGIGFPISGNVAAVLSWWYSFWVLAVPGFVLAATLCRLLPEPAPGGQGRYCF